MYEVILKTSHPTGVYHRAGMEFTRTEPVKMNIVPEAVLKDPWLEVKKVAADSDSSKSSNRSSRSSRSSETPETA